MYDRILVPTDGSDASLNAVEEAVDLAEDQGARLYVLNVVEPPAVEPMNTPTGDVVTPMEQAGERVVEQTVERATDAGLSSVVGDTVTGMAHREIVDYVEDNDIDLVVLGTHGRTGLDRVLLGSVTEKVVRVAPVPVLTVRPAE